MLTETSQTIIKLNSLTMRRQFGPEGLNWTVDDATDAINLLRSRFSHFLNGRHPDWPLHAVSSSINEELGLPIKPENASVLVTCWRLNQEEWDKFVPPAGRDNSSALS